MRRLLSVAILTIALVATAAGTHTPANDTIEMSGTVTDDDYNYYIAQDRVAYPEEFVREEVDGEVVEKPVYTNVTVDRFAAMKASDFAADAVEQEIRAVLGAQNMTDVGIGTMGHDTHAFAVRVAYREPHDEAEYMSAPTFSYDTLREITPENIDVTVRFADQTRIVNVPVGVTRTQPERQVGGDGSDAVKDAGTASQSGSSDGIEWRVNVERERSGCWSGNHSEQLRDVSYDDSTDEGGDRAITFTGTIETGTPCHKIAATSVERDGDRYTLNLVTNRTDEPCVDCVGAVTYTATFGAEQTPYRLRVQHNGELVQDMDFPGYEPGDPSSSPQPGIIGRIVNWLQRLF